MSKEALKEEIKFLTEIFRLVWVSVLGVGGGTLSLMIGERTTLRDVLVIAGVVTVVVLGSMLQGLQRHIRRLIAQITED
jgi:hypothetical protein